MSRAVILNVNDQPAVRYMVSKMLGARGFEVVEAATGVEAIERAAAGPDCIVLDVRLPDMDGYEVTRRLKASPRTATIPVLLTSAAFVDAEHRVEGLDSGADAYLVQPFEPAELGALINALLRARAAERSALEALRMRDDFLSIASHELRTPVDALSFAAQSLRRMLELGVDATDRRDQFQSKVNVIVRQTQHLSGLVGSLLDVSRIRTGNLALRRERTDLAALVRDVAERVRSEYERTATPLTVIADTPVVGLWDAPRLEQVVTNLLTNACNYGERRPVEARVWNDADDAAVLTVQDHGVGIPDADKDRIFERFERAAPDPSRPGFGLGLWIVNQIVTASGGTVSVDSAPGRGALFTVRLRRGEQSLGADRTPWTA